MAVRDQRQIATYAALFVYGCVVACSVWRHEPWADEAQAWLLARDGGLIKLWSTLLHYEGSPGLWHTVLWVLIKLGVPYRGEQIASALLGCSASWMLLTRSPFPIVVRLLLPFTYFLCYQYAVVARSYSLLPVLLFASVLLYHRSDQHLLTFTVILGLLAGVSVHGFLLSGSIWSVSQLGFLRKWQHLSGSTKKRVLMTDIGYLTVLILLAYSAWPAPDVAFPARAAFSASKAMQSTSMLLTEGFGGNLLVTVLIIGLSIPFLFAGGGLSMLLVSLIGLAGFSGVVYSQVWHSGTLFLAWLSAMWISAARVKMPRTALAALAILIPVQCYWTFRTVAYDWREPYSGSKEAAQYLLTTGIAKRTIQGVGYSCVAIQPYFPRSVFANYAPGEAYWDWSARNRVNEPNALFATTAPDYVMLGYHAESDIHEMPAILNLAGYRQSKHFAGHLFWRTSIFEAEDFDLYRRTRPAAVERSHLEMGDPAAAVQLLSGFYPAEEHAWRWSARTFSVVLKAPEGARSSGAKFEMHLFVPEQISRLGLLTINGDVNGYLLKAQTFSSSGNYTYERDIPANVFAGNVAIASFAFDKALRPSASEERELGAVISSLGFTPRP